MREKITVSTQVNNSPVRNVALFGVKLCVMFLKYISNYAKLFESYLLESRCVSLQLDASRLCDSCLCYYADYANPT